ncbi:transport protein TonB [Lacunisphaera limnophila]|uniref:Protein TonB n=1 Tax=Lacunisphaera limnophila TaxID=1838286 RepID=A0A1D8AT84_9BACT|nr:TonB family protein [Lacunisphaera limnophila]AOS44114.1 transport protein TonB [Lacunisphaera limnophila]
MIRYTLSHGRSVRLALVAGLMICSLTSSGAEPGPNNASGADVLPKSVRRDPPLYPYNAAKAGLNGKVQIEFIVDEAGDVINPHVVRSNNPWFERPALDAVLKWKFEPGRKGGRPVKVRANQLLEFDSGAALGGHELWRVPARNPDPEAPPELRWTKPPTPINTAFPVYPWGDFEARRDGRTDLRFVIGPQGRVIAAKVVSATTPEMAEAVLAMIDTWEFTPAQKADGTPCFSAFSIQHDFRHAGIRGDVPITEGAHRILRRIQKSPEKIVSAAQLDERPRALSTRPPVYPTKLLQAGQPGSAQIEFIIDEEGDAQLPRIVASTEPAFGYAAVQAVATWRFAPPRQGGKPVATRVQVPIDFAPPKIEKPATP